MSIRNLDYLFKPKSVALIGASDRQGSVGAVVAQNLLHGGFSGPVMTVNPKHRTIAGVATYPDVGSLPQTPELAVICTPPPAVPGTVVDLGKRGTKAAVVITAGFGEGEDRIGADLRQAMLDAARPHLLRIVGPNCVGILVPGLQLNASFAHIAALKGDLAFVAQSGAIVTSIVDWATPRNIGFSHLVSLGDMADVDFGDMLDYLAMDGATRAILLYMEGVTHPRKFMSAARIAARLKPVIVVKAGRHAEGAKAASSHTGAMAGSDEVYDAAFRRAGMLRVYELDELFDAVETLALCRPFHGDRIAILTNGGGIGVMATDSLIDQGGHLAALSPETMQVLNKVLPPTWSHGNPVDIVGDAQPERYVSALEALLQDNGTDAVLVLNCPTAVASSTAAAQAVIEVAAKSQRALLTSWVGESAVAEARNLFARARIPTYEAPNQAMRAFMHMAQYRRNQDLLAQLPASVPEEFSPDTAKARAAIEAAIASGREWLTEPEAKEVLEAYRIPCVPTRVARSPEDAARLAEAFNAPCAVKILSPDITHKSDVGGVALDLATPAAVRDAASAMLARIKQSHPSARIDGVTVEPMIRPAGGWELIVGMTEDSQFGPVILFGHGGIAAEILADKALTLAPLNANIANALMARTRVYRLLQGFRNQPPADLAAIALVLVKVSQLVVDIGEIVELDINPLVAGSSGATALDARIRVRPAKVSGAARLAIRPYPSTLKSYLPLPDGRRLLLRPVRPEDAFAFEAAFAKLSPKDIRLRFFASLRSLTPHLMARLTQIDYDREMALVLCEDGKPAGSAEVFGVVRVAADPDNDTAEFAIIVRSDVAGRGFGTFLMGSIIDYARSRGIRSLFGDILHENTNMLALCRRLGFTVRAIPEDPSIVRAELPLR
ncbi:MAG TPA: bifunctional acetate--CoA ligase family protein/GNAT family N-acetyltransferase [Candidatus Cybelea sp.]|nr:bifunctional acetate--CoA ligase family protein/GNAT family N-acetyltransferase [Candidatus Cybelea sp.]